MSSTKRNRHSVPLNPQPMSATSPEDFHHHQAQPIPDIVEEPPFLQEDGDDDSDFHTPPASPSGPTECPETPIADKSARSPMFALPPSARKPMKRGRWSPNMSLDGTLERTQEVLDSPEHLDIPAICAAPLSRLARHTAQQRLGPADYEDRQWYGAIPEAANFVSDDDDLVLPPQPRYGDDNGDDSNDDDDHDMYPARGACSPARMRRRPRGGVRSSPIRSSRLKSVSFAAGDDWELGGVSGATVGDDAEGTPYSPPTTRSAGHSPRRGVDGQSQRRGRLRHPHPHPYNHRRHHPSHHEPVAVGGRGAGRRLFPSENDTSLIQVDPVQPNMFTPNKSFTNPKQKLVDSSSYYATTFEEKSELGKGEFSVVYKVMHRLAGCAYAVKRLRKPKPETPTAEWFREAHALAALPVHPNVIRYYNAWSERNILFIQTELCSGGALSDRIRHDFTFSDNQMHMMVYQLCQGLRHLHNCGLVHLDVKPENIYIHPMSRADSQSMPTLAAPSPAPTQLLWRTQSQQMMNVLKSGLHSPDTAAPVAHGSPIPLSVSTRSAATAAAAPAAACAMSSSASPSPAPSAASLGEADHWLYKIGDLGLAQSTDITLWEETAADGGDGRYMAPELLNQEKKSLRDRLPKCDVYSLGVSMYEVARGQALSKAECAALREGRVAALPNRSCAFNKLLALMMHPVVDVRPSPDTVLKYIKPNESPETIKLKEENARLSESNQLLERKLESMQEKCDALLAQRRKLQQQQQPQSQPQSVQETANLQAMNERLARMESLLKRCLPLASAPSSPSKASQHSAVYDGSDAVVCESTCTSAGDVDACYSEPLDVTPLCASKVLHESGGCGGENVEHSMNAMLLRDM